MKTELKSAKFVSLYQFLWYIYTHTQTHLDRQIHAHAPNMKKASIKGLPKPKTTTTKWLADSWGILTHYSLAVMFLIYTSSTPLFIDVSTNTGNKLKLIFSICVAFCLSIPIFLSLRSCILCCIYRPISFNLVISSQVSAKQITTSNYFSHFRCPNSKAKRFGWAHSQLKAATSKELKLLLVLEFLKWLDFTSGLMAIKLTKLLFLFWKSNVLDQRVTSCEHVWLMYNTNKNPIPTPCFHQSEEPLLSKCNYYIRIVLNSLNFLISKIDSRISSKITT